MLQTRIVKMLEVSEGSARVLIPLAEEIDEGDRFKVEVGIGRSLKPEEWRDLCCIHGSWRRSYVTDTYEKRVVRLLKGGSDVDNTE